MVQKMERLYFDEEKWNGVLGKNLEAYPFFMSYVQDMNMSVKSIKVYLNRFIQFINFLSCQHDIYIDSLYDFQNVDSNLVKDFIENDMDSQSTKKSKYYALQSLFEYLKKMGVLTVNPLSGISIPKVQSQISLNYLTDKEITKICRHLEKELKQTTKQKKIYRDLAMFSLALSTGLKPSVIVQLHTSDYKDGSLYVENMKIKLHKQTIKRLEDYLNLNDQEMMFVNRNNNAMSVRQFEKVLESYEPIIHRKVNPQMLRATYAHGALQKNVSTLDIAKQMGITPVTLVTRYLETTL